jgi:hypothetical protein
MGQTNSPIGFGVYGLANNANGVNYGVYGRTTSPTGYAGYFVGGRNFFQGNVGIGLANPVQKLDVSGNVKVSGWIGTDANAPVTIASNGQQVMRLEFATDGAATDTANIVAGFSGNQICNNVIGGTVAGGGAPGEINQACGNFAFVGGGLANTAGLAAVVGGGEGNQATGNFSAIPGGLANAATNAFGFAAGRRAKSAHVGAFVWGDSTDADVISTAADQFMVRASGGVQMFDSTGVGVQLAPGGNSWSALSDRNVKQNFKPVNPREVLAKLAKLPITRWNLISQDESVHHIGPMAQDFYAAFNIGEDDRRITQTDADGVAFAAIQGLHELVQEKEREINRLRAEHEAQMNAMMKRIERLEASLKAD